MSPSSGRHFFISYSRTDTTQKQNIIKQLRARGINLWVVADNVRKGAALNSIQIAEILLKEYL